MENDRSEGIRRIRSGQPPGNAALLEEMSVGIDFVTDFWRQRYFDEYIRWGGSKIKFITGNEGSGKTHALELLLTLAKRSGYLCASFSAGRVWVHDFMEIYRAIYAQVDLYACLGNCARRIIREMGFDPEELPEGIRFAGHLSSLGLMDPLTKREIRTQLTEMFLRNPALDNNFALCCSLITGGILGYPTLEEHNQALLFAWLSGSREPKLADLRKLGLSPGRITKNNARHMLRSLVEVIRLAGHAGLVVGVDNLDALVFGSGIDEIHYTKIRREDAYESIRELIDEIDTLKNVMFLFAFHRRLIDDDRAGIKSYQALWMRIQNEIEGERFNRFSDIADLDRLARQHYSADVIMEMSRRLALILEGSPISPIGEDAARELLQAAQFGHAALPRQVNHITLSAQGDETNGL